MSSAAASLDRGKADGRGSPFRVERVRPARERLLEAMLAAVGELGYERATVQQVIERARASRATFYRNFSDKEDCFAQAHGLLADWVYARLAAAARRKQLWREQLRAALSEALEMCANQPAFARALIVEPLTAGGQAREKHEWLLERLSEDLDEARRESTGETPPQSTSAFTLGAIETLLRGKLMAREVDETRELLPTLLYLAVMPYFGEAAAWEEIMAAPLAGWESRRIASSERP